MNNNFTDRIKQNREEQAKKRQEQTRHDDLVGAVKDSGSQTKQEIMRSMGSAAKGEDISSVTDAIHKLNMTTFMATKDNWQDVVEQLAELSSRMQSVINNLDDNAAKKIEKGFSDTVSRLEKLASTLKSTQVESDPELKAAIRELQGALNGLEISPVVNVPAPKVTVSEREVDFTPLISVLEGLQDGLKRLGESQPTFDTSDLSDGLSNVEQAVRDLIAKPIPVPEAAFPFKNTSNQGTQGHVVTSTSDSTKVGVVVLNPDGSNIAGGVGGGGTQYAEDTASTAGEQVMMAGAVRKDAGTSLVDTDGDRTELQVDSSGNLRVNVAAGAAAGTEYTEDAAAAANPAGPMTMARRKDTLSAAEVTTDGDNIAVNATAKGEIYVKQTDAVPVTDNGGSLTVDGTVAATQSGTWNVGTLSTVTNVVHVDDNAGSLTVDGSVTATPEKASSATLANVSTSTSSATLIASNSSRKKAVIVNDSAANMYVKYGTTASATSFSYLLQPNDTLEELNYTGRIDGILASGTGSARTSEL